MEFEPLGLVKYYGYVLQGDVTISSADEWKRFLRFAGVWPVDAQPTPDFSGGRRLAALVLPEASWTSCNPSFSLSEAAGAFVAEFVAGPSPQECAKGAGRFHLAESVAAPARRECEVLGGRYYLAWLPNRDKPLAGAVPMAEIVTGFATLVGDPPVIGDLGPSSGPVEVKFSLVFAQRGDRLICRFEYNTTDVQMKDCVEGTVVGTRVTIPWGRKTLVGELRPDGELRLDPGQGFVVRP